MRACGEGGGGGGGGVGSREAEVRFSTYQRLVLASQPHSRPPTVCVCVSVCASAPGKPSIDTQLSTALLIQTLHRDHCASQEEKQNKTENQRKLKHKISP